MIWNISGKDLPKVTVEADSFDEAIHKAREISPEYCTGQVLAEMEQKWSRKMKTDDEIIDEYCRINGLYFTSNEDEKRKIREIVNNTICGASYILRYRFNEAFKPLSNRISDLLRRFNNEI